MSENFLNIDGIINFHTIYVLSVTLIFATLYLFFRSRVDTLKQKRIISLQRKQFEPIVETETPIDDPVKAQRQLGRESIDTRFNFIKKFLPIVMGVFWFSVVVIPYLTRVPAIHVSLVIGSISVLIGIAARPFIENIISGLVISFAQPIRIGDTVLINDHYGNVEDIKLTHSIINIWDWRRLIIPNSQMLSKEIVNYSINDLHLWAWIEFYVSKEADLEQVEEKAKAIAMESDVFLDVEEPAFWVMGLERDSVRCWLAAWVDSPINCWAMRSHMRKELAKFFREQDISFHVFNVNQGVGAPPSEMGERTHQENANPY